MTVLHYFADDPTQMVVTWVTQETTSGSIVEYGLNDLQMVAKGIEEVFQDGGSEQRTLYQHRVTLKNLESGAQYSKTDRPT